MGRLNFSAVSKTIWQSCAFLSRSSFKTSIDVDPSSLGKVASSRNAKNIPAALSKFIDPSSK